MNGRGVSSLPPLRSPLVVRSLEMQRGQLESSGTGSDEVDYCGLGTHLALSAGRRTPHRAALRPHHTATLHDGVGICYAIKMNALKLIKIFKGSNNHEINEIHDVQVQKLKFNITSIKALTHTLSAPTVRMTSYAKAFTALPSACLSAKISHSHTTMRKSFTFIYIT